MILYLRGKEVVGNVARIGSRLCFHRAASSCSLFFSLSVEPRFVHLNLLQETKHPNTEDIQYAGVHVSRHLVGVSLAEQGGSRSLMLCRLCKPNDTGTGWTGN